MSDAIPSPDQSMLAAALLDAARYPHPVDGVERIETHISYVFLAGPYAYKIKKTVDLGFLDFTTLARRRFYCLEELRLNRRLAPAIYLDVIAITGTPTQPVLQGEGEPIEYAVKMRRFAQADLFDARLARGQLAPAHLDGLADEIAAFHATSAVASADDPFGTADAICEPALENFVQLRATPDGARCAADLDALESWTRAQTQALAAEFTARKAQGFVRECHGDFHLGNVALVDDAVAVFDCLEFSANLRWIDVINDIAFMVMDLRDRNRPDLAQRFLNRYLEITGDYAGLRLLRFYVVYRAMVRAKVHALRAGQPHVETDQRTAALDAYRNYIGFARRETATTAAALIITHGLSGSGKTTHTQALLQTIGAVRIRSDVERKRLRGLTPTAQTGSGIDEGLYAADMNTRTYRHLAELAAAIVQAGYPVIVDATFLRRTQRDAFRELATSLGVRFLIIDFAADESTLRVRVAARRRQARDASEADIDVLERQLQTLEPLQPDERESAIVFDTVHANSDAVWRVVNAQLAAPSG